MTDDEPLGPVPWHVTAYVAVFSNPLVASVLLAVPVASVAGLAAPWIASTLPFGSTVEIPKTAYAVAVWFSATVMVWVHFTKPY